MDDILIDMGLAALLRLLKDKVPNDSKTKSKWKKAMLKVFKAIGTAYSDDKDFNV
jgi:hypothetical protein